MIKWPEFRNFAVQARVRTPVSDPEASAKGCTYEGVGLINVT
jgi:hypothetical protein